jgi:A/G-specific adenine glycosylase
MLRLLRLDKTIAPCCDTLKKMKQPTKRNARPQVRLLSNGLATANMLDPWPSPQWKVAFRRRLLSWFSRHARPLPWRQTREAYPIWISEIMLQQTQVSTVIPYFERFLRRFPTVRELAAGDEQDVLRLWEGLGYYRRARQLHAAARRIVEEHDGKFPAQPEELRRLPGIGRYTTGAILSLAFDSRQPILEANTLRLFARLLAFRGDTLASTGQKLLWNAAEAILPRRQCGRVNQSLMELGSLVCTARAPRCMVCPVATLCASRRAGLQSIVPAPKPKPRIEHIREAAVVIRSGDKVLLVQRAVGDRWAGLWDFPRFALAESKESPAAELVAKMVATCSLNIVLPQPVEPLTTLHHGVTRFRITLEVFAASVEAGSCNNSQSSRHSAFAQQRWVRPSALVRYPLSTTGRRIAKLVTCGTAGTIVSR